MGIPAYFSHIIKNHSPIVKNVVPDVVSALLIDSNSIVYDAVHSLPIEDQTAQNIIDITVQKIKHYISVVQPRRFTYIAFDGIAPFAKMEQQKKRRYKSTFVPVVGNLQPKGGFNTVMITPGTPFMKMLSDRIHLEFSSQPNIVVSTSTESGEGEHKMCLYLRENPLLNENVVFYGLDADLIMLAIFHLGYTGNIYVCREKPSFSLTQEPSSPADNELLYLDIQKLIQRIWVEMNCKDNSGVRVHDYVFMCFFLGNDFLPSFPSLNIRTSGITRLMDTYRKYIGAFHDRSFLSNDGKIIWKWVRLFVKELARYEREFLLQEYDFREKCEQQTMKRLIMQKATTDEWTENAPILFREVERFISPFDSFWEKRYYQSLFHNDPMVECICQDYLKGLEWVYSYYTKGCVNTQWKYKYHYPPLLVDLLQYIVNKEHHTYLERCDTAITQEEQLRYILPPVYWADAGLTELITPLEQNAQMRFTWAFKRYFWEAHLL